MFQVCAYVCVCLYVILKASINPEWTLSQGRVEEKVCGHPGFFLDLKGLGEDSGVGREAALLAGGRSSR